MKNAYLKKVIRLSILSFILLFGINPLVQGQESNNQALIVAKEVLSYLREGNADKILSALDKRVIEQGVTKEQIDELVKQGKIIIDEYHFPSDSEIKLSEQFFITVEGTEHKIDHYDFPFISKQNKDSVKHILISIFDKESTVRLFISDDMWGRKIIEPSYSEPHLENFNLQFKDVSWFRIWYSNGYKNDRIIKGKDYYAVSGGKFNSDNIVSNKILLAIDSISNSDKIPAIEKEESIKYLKEIYEQINSSLSNLNNEYSIKDPKINDLFSELFNCVNTASIDSTDYKYLDEDKIGDPEWISLRFKIDNPDYKDLGEFKISCFWNEGINKNNILSEYIIIKHSDKTRYLLSKNKNPKLLTALRKIADHDYEKYYEENP